MLAYLRVSAVIPPCGGFWQQLYFGDFWKADQTQPNAAFRARRENGIRAGILTSSGKKRLSRGFWFNNNAMAEGGEEIFCNLMRVYINL